MLKNDKLGKAIKLDERYLGENKFKFSCNYGPSTYTKIYTKQNTYIKKYTLKTYKHARTRREKIC